ncbi:hypothetical protein [Embleya sp. AB8]|uniref:hypothetical protein n=1 Tax=Embleya sp. AB8 TaxID=3156304 RepID=UPI003C75F237
MTDHLLSGDTALPGVSRRLLMTARDARRHQRPGPPTSGFRLGPAWAWCPAEACQTPQRFDAGRRRCLASRTTTIRETPRG